MSDDRSAISKELESKSPILSSLVPYLLLAIASIVPFVPSLSGEFLWDDVDLYIVRNPLLRDAAGLYKFWFTSEPIDYYPLTYTTFWLEYRLAGLNPTIYHVDNVVIHFLTCLIVWRVLGTLQFQHAWIVALLFACHPVCVESVSWITQRKTVLAAMLGFASLWQFVEFSGRRSKWRLLLSTLLFALSLSAKPTMIGIPVIITAYLWLKNQNLVRRDVADVGGCFAVAVVFGLVGIWFQNTLTTGVDVRGQTFMERLATCGMAFWFYVYKTVLPLNLSFVYPRWEVDGSNPVVYLPSVLVAVTLLMCYKFRASIGIVWFAAIGFFVVSAAPGLGIIDVFFWRYSFVGDHYIYQSLPAMIVVLVTGVGYLLKRFSVMDRIGLPIALAAACLLGVLCWNQAAIYRSEESVWTDTLEKSPESYLALNQLARIRLAQHREAEVEDLLQRSLRVNPQPFEALYNLGRLRLDQGSIDEAESQFRSSYELWPKTEDRSVNAIAGFAACRLRSGDAATALGLVDDMLAKQESLPALTQGLLLTVRAASESATGQPTARTEAEVSELLETHPSLSYELGRFAINCGDLTIARPILQRAIEFDGNDAGAHANYAISLAQTGELDEALVEFERAADLDRQNAVIRANFGRALLQSGRVGDAAKQWSEAYRLQPDFANVARDLAFLLATRPECRDPERALQIGLDAVKRTRASEPGRLDALAAAYAATGQFDPAAETALKGAEVARTHKMIGLADAISARAEHYRMRKPPPPLP